SARRRARWPQMIAGTLVKNAPTTLSEPSTSAIVLNRSTLIPKVRLDCDRRTSWAMATPFAALAAGCAVPPPEPSGTDGTARAGKMPECAEAPEAGIGPAFRIGWAVTFEEGKGTRSCARAGAGTPAEFTVTWPATRLAFGGTGCVG